MRTKHLFTFLLPLSAFLPSSFAAAPGLLPDGRPTVDVRAGERNPFAQQAVQEQALPASTESVSEEVRLRKVLRALKIGGTSVGKDGPRALLGSIILQPGETLPPLIRNQAEVLRVVSVEESSLTLAFVERDPTADARKVVLPFSMKPEVASFMYGEAVESLLQMGPKGLSKLPPLKNPDVAEILKSTQEVDLKGMAARDIELMGVVRDDEKSEQ